MSATAQRTASFVAPLLLGWVWGQLLPRGAQTGPQVVGTVVVFALVGVVLGRWAQPSAGDRTGGRLPTMTARAAALVAVLAWVGVEAARIGSPAPSVGAIPAQLFEGSTYAAAALVLGRGVDLLTTLVPLAAGIAVGLRRTWPRVTVLALVLLAGIPALVPATTPPVSAGGIAEVTSVDVGGCRQRVTLRGANHENPVVLFLSGGPGGTEIGTLGRQWHDIEQEFTVAVWDQTGAGLNGHCVGGDPVTLDRLRSDAAVVLEHVAGRFGQKVVVVGNSWGTFLGSLLVHDRPQFVAAYVGSGQMVSMPETDRMFHADTLAWARSVGDGDLVTRLTGQGAPPYGSIYPYEEVFAHEGAWNHWTRDPGIAAAVNPLTNVVDRPELDPVSKVRYVPNVIDTFSTLYPTVQGVDLRRDVPALQVPVYLAHGVHEARGRTIPARAWFDSLAAPRKEWVVFERSGHKAFGEQPGEFLDLLRRVSAAARR